MRVNMNRGAIPLYLQIKNDLKEKIEQGVYPRGSLIPPEPQLEAMFHVSRITVRQAINELAQEGYVHKRRGKGTCVTYSDKINESASEIRSFTKEAEDRGLVPGTSYVSIELVEPTSQMREYLELKEDEKVYQLVRIRTMNEKPIVLFETYIPGRFDLPLEPDAYKGSMYEMFEQAGIGRPVMIKETFSAILASDSLSKSLSIKKGKPILKRIRLSLDLNNRPIEYTISYYDGDRYEYSVELHNR